MMWNPDYEQLKYDIKNEMAEMCRRERIAGISLALVDEGDTAFTCAYGYSDIDAGIPMTEDTITGVASISKVFTATAVMQLVEAGRMDLDAPVTEYIPEFSVKSRYADKSPIRIRHLMTHHSGLPRDWLNHFYAYETEPFQKIIEWLKDEYVCHPAGYYYSYSNLAIALLGTALERAAGVPYEQYMQEHILAPLQMEKSAFHRDYRHSGLYAQAYDKLERRAELPLRDKPGGGLYSCASDLAHLASMYLCGGTYKGAALLCSDTIQKMFEPQADDAAMSFHKRIGLNWHLDRPALEYAGRVAHHGGALVYFRSNLCLLPDHGLGVAVLANSSTASGVVSALADKALSGAMQIKRGIAPVEPRMKPFVLKAPLRIASPEGHYATSRGYVRIDGAKRAYRCLLGGRRYDMMESADGSYTLGKHSMDGFVADSRVGSLSLRFCADPRYGVKTMLIDGWPDGEAFEPEPVPEAWEKRQGRYNACNRMPEEAFTDILYAVEIKVIKGILFADLIGPGYRQRRVLKAVSDTEAVRLGWEQGGNETFHAAASGPPRLRYMGIEFMRV